MPSVFGLRFATSLTVGATTTRSSSFYALGIGLGFATGPWPRSACLRWWARFYAPVPGGLCDVTMFVTMDLTREMFLCPPFRAGLCDDAVNAFHNRNLEFLCSRFRAGLCDTWPAC